MSRPIIQFDTPDNNEEEIWCKISGHTNLSISNYGRIHNDMTNKFIGSFYGHGANNDLGNRCYLAISDLLKTHFGMNKRIVFIPLSKRKEALNVINHKKYNKHEYVYRKPYNRQEIIDLWLNCSGVTGDFDNYFKIWDMDIHKIVKKMNDHIYCMACITVEDEKEYTVRWTGSGKYELTTGYLTFHILRYFLQREDLINKITQMRTTYLYPDEINTFRNICYIILGYKPWYEVKNVFDEDEQDEMTAYKLLDKNKNRQINRETKKDFFVRTDNESEEETFEHSPLNYTNFFNNSTCDVDLKLSLYVYDIIPPEKKKVVDRNKISKVNANIIFDQTVKDMYPIYTYSEICYEIAQYFTTEDTIFNYFKLLELKWQRKILHELGVSIYENR